MTLALPCAMSSEPTLQVEPPSIEAFTLLDGVDVRPSWAGPLASTLLDLIQGCSEIDGVVLRELRLYANRYGADLASWVARTHGHQLSVPSGIHATYPVSATLFRIGQSFRVEQPEARKSPGLRLLTCILVNAALEEAGGERLVVPLGEVIRGAMDDSDSVLRVILADASSVPDMLSRVELHMTTSSGLHLRFEHLWRTKLRDRLYYWLQRDQSRLRRALAPRTLVPDLDAPSVELPTQSAADDLDDSLAVGCVISDEPDPNGWPRSGRTEYRRAKATELVRASHGNVLVPPDFWIPPELVTRLAHRTVASALRLQESGNMPGSERYVALAFTLATGLRELDLDEVHWGEDGKAMFQLSTIRPILRRKLLRPPNAVQPSDDMAPFLEATVEYIDWPIPPSVHDLLRNLSGKQGPIVGHCVLPQRIGIAAPYRLRDAIASLDPGLALGAGPIRLAMAAHLNARFGVEMAQLAMGDTFSMSAAATYYSALPLSELNGAITQMQRAWFGDFELPEVSAARVYVGSRLVLADAAAQRWPADLRHQSRSLAHRKDRTEIEEWRAHRNFLAASLCAVTGHRPVNALGQIRLDDIIADYGLIVLQDKQIDVLRKARIAATGQRWLVELRAFLDRLIIISSSRKDAAASSLAMAILRSEAPLFSVPGAGGEEATFDASELRKSMPQELKVLPNFYRHRVNQYLHRCPIDPQLRHAQLGWVLSPTHALADLSPLSARQFAAQMGPILDSYLIDDGWFPKGQRISPWSWDGIPMRQMKDWATIVAKHETDHTAQIRQVKQQIAERGRAIEIEVLPRLARAIIETLPSLRLDVEHRRLVRSNSVAKSSIAVIEEETCRLICDRVRQGDSEPISAHEAVTARILLHRLIKNSHREGLTQGFIPRRPLLSVMAEPSPFLPGLGLAVRQSEALRCAILLRAQSRRPHDSSVLTALSVICFSPYRNIDLAQASMSAAAEAQRGNEPGDWLRVPAIVDRKPYPMVLSGIPALFLMLRGRETPTARAPSAGKIERWLEEHLQSVCESSGDYLHHFLHTMRASARIELSGPERLVLLDQTHTESVSVDRCLARDNNWPVQTRIAPHAEEVESIRPLHEAEERGSPLPSSLKLTVGLYRNLTAILNPDLLPAIIGKRGDGKRGWRGFLAKELKKLCAEVGESSVVGLLVGFAMYRLRFGGKVKRELQHRTLHREVTRFGRDLIDVVGSSDLLSLDAEQLRHSYLAVIMGKPRPARPHTMEALRLFQRYLENEHQTLPVDFSALQRAAGPRTLHVDAGLLTDNEIAHVLRILRQDLETERKRPDASPEMVRLYELRVIACLLMDASGARPATIHGLALGDMHLLGDVRDYIHVRRTGDYGEAKSIAAIGFIPLEGERWSHARGWIRDWLSNEVKGAEDGWERRPLFAADKGGVRRFNRGHVLSRVSSLVRGVSDDPDARVYWFRKSRIMARHRRAMDAERGATEVRAALASSGHATISTPITHYISDPSIVVAHSLVAGRYTARSELLQATDLQPQRLDMAWLRRGGARGGKRVAVVFDQLGLEASQTPTERLTEPPAIPRQRTLKPADLDRFAREMQRSGQLTDAMMHSGLSRPQVDRLEIAAAQLLMKSGKVPWSIPGLQHPRAVLSSPRRLPSAKAILELLNDDPTESLYILSRAWARRGFASRMMDVSQSIALVCELEVAAARVVYEAIGVDAVVVEVSKSIWALEIPVCEERAASKSGRTRNARAALIWVLALVWLHERVLESK